MQGYKIMDREEINKWLKEKNVEIGKPLNSGIPRLIKNKYLNDFKRETNSSSDNATELLYLLQCNRITLSIFKSESKYQMPYLW